MGTEKKLLSWAGARFSGKYETIADTASSALIMNYILAAMFAAAGIALRGMI
jgi:hypothetical protein